MKSDFEALLEANHRIEELDAKAESLRDDANLGKLVRQMPVDSEFYHDETEEWRIVYRSEGDWHYRICTTPEDALREALGEERDEAE